MKIAIKNKSIIKIYNGEISYQALILFIKKEFQLSPSRYTLTYVDQDGDNITLASNEDMTSAYELNTDKSQLMVKLYLHEATGEDGKVQFEVIRESFIAEPNIQEEPKKEEEPQKEQAHGHKWHQFGFSGKNRSHHKSPSEPFQEGHHRHERRFKRFYQMINMAIAEKVDERVKTLLPCIKAQLQGGKFIKTFSIENSVIHENTECKSCLSVPIVGIRYRCLQCPAFSLCQNCEPLIQHEHNLLKMKHATQERREFESPFKLFNHFWRHGGHHGRNNSHSLSSDKCGKEGRITIKLAKIFKGEPKQYQEFSKANQALNKFQLINKYATQNGQEDLLINFRCEKIARHLNKQPQELKELVKNNLNVRPWELIHKLSDNGFEAPSFFGGKCERYQRRCEKLERKWQQEERKCKKSLQGEVMSHQKLSHNGNKPSRKQKSPQKKISFNNKERTEKGKILEALIGLFGGSNVKEYFELIEQHFSIGEEGIINKWLETHCSQTSA